jgi:type II secretory pathway component PulC
MLAHVGDTVAHYQVVQIEENFVVLEADGRRIELTRMLTPLGTAPSALVATDDDPEKQGIPFWDQPALETNRFGKRIDTNRWVFKRDKVMDYYNELLADPSRLVNLYKSFWPDRKNGEVDGFNIKYAGEQDFFKSVGLRECDTVRMVNSMKMTSQRRAEFFIGEFVRQNLDAIVFDIERDGKEEQLVYLIR